MLGLDWWPKVWGDRYDPLQPVLRVEFEFGRQGLVEYQGSELRPQSCNEP